MNTSRKGNTLEARFTQILRKQGWMMAAKATRAPIYGRGRGLTSKSFVVAGGDVDLLDGSIDRIFLKPGRRALCVQVTTTNGASERRQKLRAIRDRIPGEHVELLLAAWDEGERAYRLYRDGLEDFLECGWRLAVGDETLPWDRTPETHRQERLP